MTIGGRYYIGRSIHIRQRAKAHKYALQKLVREPAPADNHYFYKMYLHLMDNPSIREYEVEVLEDCAKSSIVECEQKWLSASEQDPLCLNVGFIAGPSSADTRAANAPKTHRGNLEWSDDGKAVFVPDINGKWLLSEYIEGTPYG